MTKRAIILMYHNISIPPKNSALKSLYVTPTMFRFQMWYLKAAGFRVVSLREVLTSIAAETDGGRRVALTFDDGYQDFYDNAYPVLLSHGYPSTVFLVSDLIGKENIWDYDNLNVRKRLLNWDGIIELKKHNVAFGSHTRTHPFLTKCPPEGLEDEVRNSRIALEERLKEPVDFFCYPYGDYDDRVLDAVRKAGYLGAITTKRGLVHKDDNPFEMRRSFIRLNTHPLSFIYRLHSAYEDRKGMIKGTRR